MFRPSAVTILSGMFLTACATGASNTPPPARAEAAVSAATAELLPTRRSEVRGTFRFIAQDGGVLVKGGLSPLPQGIYGLGIHEGDCSAHDAKSARGYVGPADATGRHLGRLDDVTSGEDGIAKVSAVDARLKLSGPGSIIGKALVVHAWPYDPKVELERVPFLACGIIRAD